MDSRASDVLKKQRYLAAQTLQRADDMRERSPLNGKTTTKSSRLLLSPPTQDWDDTRSENGSMLLQPRQYRAVNITELEEDKTIHLQATPQKVSFEPKEIAARSTMEKFSSEQSRRKLAMEQMAPDIHAILNESIAPEVRELSGMYSGRMSTDSAADLLRRDDRPDVSLPRTADMSRISAMRESISSNASKAGAGGDFWDLPASGAAGAAAPFASSWMQKELTQLEDISFHPAESQQSRLLADELAWEQENAIIPQMNAQKPTTKGQSPMERLKIPRNLKNHVDFSCFSGYLAQEEAEPMQATRIEDSSYCSVGEYFNKMSDDLKGMISESSPPRRTPLPLVDVSNIEATDESSGKTPIKPSAHADSLSDATDKENSLSVSKIMKAIGAIHLEDSPSDFINKIQHLRKGKSGRPSMPSTPKPKSPAAAAVHKTASLKTDLASVVQTPSFVRDLQQAKQRPPKCGNLSDTASFTESLLESSAFVPIDPRVITSSPKEVSAPSSVAKSDRSDASTAKKPFLNTYRVSTATKLSPNQLELPPIPMIREAPKCQKQILTDGPPVKPNRKRRSSSATRQELLDAEEKRLEVTRAHQKRSRSPANGAELKAVASHLTVYNETPKSTIPSQRAVAQQPKQQANRSFLSPEPRNRDIYVNDRSPFTSPKSVGSTDMGEIDRAAYSEPSKSPRRYNMLGSARSASQCSVTGSEFSHKDGVLPLKSTHSELSWPSTKLRKSEKKSIQIKNMSNKKLIIKSSITGPGFQLCGTEQVLTLHSQECRTVTIDFCPTVIGPAVGLLSFLPPHDNYVHRSVSLFGYGGEASIRAEGIQKGPTGPYLELGQARNLGRPLEKSFTLYNKGNLPAFARIGIDMKKVDQTFLASAVIVQPQKVIIPPNTYVHINVSFKPRRQEIAKILQKHVDVLSITNLHIIWGDEPTRHRLRRIISLIKRNELQEENLSPLASVCEFIPNEREFDELDCFTENLFQTVHELFLTFREYELVLTIDRALDETMIDFTLTEDSSALFKTMYISDGGSPRMPEDISPAALQSAKRQSGESWSVRPTSLEFSHSERTKQFVIKSNFYTMQFFDLNSNFRPLFKFSPGEGQIRPGQEVIVNVDFLMGPHPQQPVFIVVYIENEKITIPVHIRNRVQQN
ncbi:hypothetical protein RP20_CCG010814 [Aedes albopictus]|nr:hypothetical protein RP20_CCG010814 [Aedes albopictus]